MKKNCKIFDYLLLVLASISLIYFIILAVNSRFINAYILYPLFTIFTSSVAIYELISKKSILAKLPKILNYLIKGVIIIGIAIFVVIEGLIIHEANDKYRQASDYVIVLGARLYGSTPAPLLRYRLDTAVSYHQQFPDTPIIVSGGQGRGEEISEAKAMKDYLIAKGVSEDNIIEENQSTNTYENIKYSKRIIESLTNEDYDVVIITNGFHCYRSRILAHKFGLNVHTYAAKENLDTAPHYYIREFFGCLKDILLS